MPGVAMKTPRRAAQRQDDGRAGTYGELMRAVIYARYSTDLQSACSIEDQLRLCRARIEAEGWSLVNSYTDHAISGASRLRPGYQKLLEDARAGTFDVVVAEALDRLSRDQEDTAALYKQLGFAGVRLVTFAEGEISELHVGLKGTMNALFLKDLAMKTRRGLEGRVRQGRSGGGLCYGYKVAAERDAAGNPIPGGREIDASEAEIVRRIFREYAAGLSPRAIARRLNAEGVPGPGGRPWGDTTIRGHALRGTGLLHNELYIGRLVWNRQRYVKDPKTGRRVARLNPERAWIIQEVPELRIVDDELWQAVQARLTAMRQSPGVSKAIASAFWKQRRPRHLLTGLARCGVCGKPLAAVGRDYLACGAARRQGTCDNRRAIRRERAGERHPRGAARAADAAGSRRRVRRSLPAGGQPAARRRRRRPRTDLPRAYAGRAQAGRAGRGDRRTASGRPRCSRRSTTSSSAAPNSPNSSPRRRRRCRGCTRTWPRSTAARSPNSGRRCAIRRTEPRRSPSCAG